MVTYPTDTAIDIQSSARLYCARLLRRASRSLSRGRSLVGSFLSHTHAHARADTCTHFDSFHSRAQNYDTNTQVNRADFFDDVCFGKTAKDAHAPPSLTDPNAGIGDSLTIINGTYLSSNCDKLGNSDPVAAVLDNPVHFVQMGKAGRLPAAVQTAIGAGPSLVSYDSSA